MELQKMLEKLSLFELETLPQLVKREMEIRESGKARIYFYDSGNKHCFKDKHQCLVEASEELYEVEYDDGDVFRIGSYTISKSEYDRQPSFWIEV